MSVRLIKWPLRSVPSEDSRYVSRLCCPHVLARLPYGPNTEEPRGINYVEDVDGSRSQQIPLGLTPSYALAQR